MENLDLTSDSHLRLSDAVISSSGRNVFQESNRKVRPEIFIRANNPALHDIIIEFTRNFTISDQRMYLKRANPDLIAKWIPWNTLFEEHVSLQDSEIRGDLYDKRVYTILLNIATDEQQALRHTRAYHQKLSTSVTKAFTPEECKLELYAEPEKDAPTNASVVEDDSDVVSLVVEEDENGDPINDFDPTSMTEDPDDIRENFNFAYILRQFCQTYPTISYILIRMGRCYPYAVAGGHKLLVKELITKIRTQSLVTSTPLPGEKTKISLPPQGTRSIPKSGEYTVLSGSYKNYESYAHSLASYATSPEILKILLKGTCVMPSAVVADAIKYENNAVIKALFKMGLPDPESRIPNAIVKMRITELQYVLCSPKYLKQAIASYDVALIREIMAHEKFEEETKNVQITPWIFYSLKSLPYGDIPKFIDMIKLLSTKFKIERIFDCHDNDGSTTPGPRSPKREVEKRSLTHKHDLLVLATSIDVFGAMVDIGLDITTPMMKRRNLMISPLVYMISSDPEEDDVRTVLGYYKNIDYVNLLYTLAALGIGGVSEICAIHNFDEETLLKAMCLSSVHHQGGLGDMAAKVISLKPAGWLPMVTPMIFEANR